MTLDEIDASLPHGFHDAQLASYSISFADRTAHLELAIWMGVPEATETYRRASLHLKGLHYWIVEPPDTNYPFNAAQDLTIDIGRTADFKDAPAGQLPPVPPGTFENSVYVEQWNARIYLAAQIAELQWTGASENWDEMPPEGMHPYDVHLLMHVTSEWRKMARIIGAAMGELDHQQSRELKQGREVPLDLLLQERLQALVAQGQLEYQGDLTKMGECELRYSGS